MNIEGDQRTITESLNALPVGSVVTDEDGDPFTKQPNGVGQTGIEALAQVLPLTNCQCEAHYSEGMSRLCREIRGRERVWQAEVILADPAPLLMALVEAGVLNRRQEIFSGYHNGHTKTWLETEPEVIEWSDDGGRD